MENIRSVICDSCSETALEFDNDSVTAEALEGRIHCCDSCTMLGKVSYDDEKGSVSLRSLTEVELSCDVEFGTLVVACEKSQKKIAELYHEIAKLRTK